MKTYILTLRRMEDGGFVKTWSTKDGALAQTVKLQWERDYGLSYYVTIKVIDPRMV